MRPLRRCSINPPIRSARNFEVSARHSHSHLGGDRRLCEPARALVGSLTNEVHVSVVSLWEIAIKNGQGRAAQQPIPVNSLQAAQLFVAAGYRLLDITADQPIAVEGLPPLHGDPFDRMLVAQALTESMALITHDASVAAYSATFLLV